ncbi:putative acetyltransferase [Lachnospiraceae bacterium]|nr:putative acetyltransferase [Lachnospiraceae bacterium]
MIRKAKNSDVCRIAEILVFDKRMKYRPIFQDDAFSFGNLQVQPVMEEYSAPEILDNIWVYEDEELGIVKGLIHVSGRQIVSLYVDYFFQGQGIGSKLIDFAKKEFDVNFLWTIKKNTDAIRFYKAHDFQVTGTRKYEEGTTVYLVMLKRE